MAAPVLDISDSESTVAQKLCDLVIKSANAAIKERNIFLIGVSGGSVAKFLCSGLPSATTDWKKWNIFFCDERYVPFDDPECTFSVYEKGLLCKIPDLQGHIFPINPNIAVESAADDYLKKIRSVVPGDGIPCFDILILGMGPDGHTCSLFPGHPLLKETNILVAPITDSPKPPLCRVTFTLPVINNACCAVFASCGNSKADIVQRVLEGGDDNPLPAAMVSPLKGKVIWFLDTAAASKLKNIPKL